MTRNRPKHGQKIYYVQVSFSMIMVMCNNNMWNWIHEKLKQQWGGEENVLLTKKVCNVISWRDYGYVVGNR